MIYQETNLPKQATLECDLVQKGYICAEEDVLQRRNIETLPYRGSAGKSKITRGETSKGKQGQKVKLLKLHYQ